MSRTLFKFFAFLIVFVASPQVHAGLYSDDMGRCLVSSTTTKDKTELVRWIFAIAALHPDVTAISSVTPEQREALSREVGKMFDRLLTESCRKQTQDALKYEGGIAMQLSFGVLGQVAMQELMNNPSVNAGYAGIVKYVDLSKLKELVPQAIKGNGNSEGAAKSSAEGNKDAGK